MSPRKWNHVVHFFPVVFGAAARREGKNKHIINVMRVPNVGNSIRSKKRA
jgi:hypothetical protein